MATAESPRKPDRRDSSDGGHTQQCPVCGLTMPAIAGSKSATCANCGYKEPCCWQLARLLQCLVPTLPRAIITKEVPLER